MNRFVLVLLIFFAHLCVAQQRYNNIDVQFDNFKGIIADSLYVPFESRNIFPKKRFVPTLAQVKEFESSFINQYGSAIKKHHELFYAQYHNPDGKDDKFVTDYKDGEKAAKAGIKRLEREYHDYDRFYYGYIGKSGARYLRIEFDPHKEKWVAAPTTGESQLYNLPPLVYNLNTHQLSLAGWTGEKDD